MSDDRDEAENCADGEAHLPKSPDYLLFLAGRFWGRDEVARTGFAGVVLKTISYLYVCFWSLLILYEYPNIRSFTIITFLLALGGLIWQVNIYVARNKRRDGDEKLLKNLRITAERKEEPVALGSWIRIKLGWEAPPAVMTLARADTPILSVEQGLAESPPTVRPLGNNASI